MKKILASSLALFLAGSFTLANGTAFAAENDGSSIDVLTSVTEGAQEDSTSGTTVTEPGNADSTVTNEDAPALVPGDFFYFMKTAFEKIELALTFDDVKEAKLLAKFSAERIAEAQSLLANGENEEAAKVMKEALATLEQAQSTIKDEDTTKEEEKVTDEVSSNDGTTVDNEDATKEEEKATDEVSSDDDTTIGDVANNEETPVVDENSDDVVKEDDDVTEVKQAISQNIIALQANLAKIKNPAAKAALQKNIVKAFAKLDKKLAKHAQNEDVEKPITDDTQNPQEDTTTNETSPVVDQENLSKDEVAVTSPTITKAKEIVKKEVKENTHKVNVHTTQRMQKPQKVQKEKMIKKVEVKENHKKNHQKDVHSHGNSHNHTNK